MKSQMIRGELPPKYLKSTKYTNISEYKYGKLTPLYRADVPSKQIMWVCLCDCSNYCLADSTKLQKGLKKSCGCTKYSCNNESDSRLHNIYEGISQRCTNPHSKSYPNYGGRGIEICAEWKGNYKEFAKWARAHDYSVDKSIDRIDVNGNYCPENCRWVDTKQQGRNRRNTLMYTYFGVCKPLKEWAEIWGISYNTLIWRLKKNFPMELMSSNANIQREQYKQNYIEYKGISMSIGDWAKELGMIESTLRRRLKKMSFEDAISDCNRKKLAL